MTSEIDLDIYNYDLNDILKLFNLPQDYNEDDLKKAKLHVLKTHPDKSGLDKKYFIFYANAYKIIKNIYYHTNKNTTYLNKDNAKIEYLANEDEIGKRELLKSIQEKKSNNFNKWFNEAFEKLNINTNENVNGYGEWFKSNDDIESETIGSIKDLHNRINEKKSKLSELSIRNEINDYYSFNHGSNLDNDQPECYESGLFSKLPFDDLKKAHTETVIPVHDNDYKNKMKFNNISELTNYRNNQIIKPLSEKEANDYLDNNKYNIEQKSLKLAYKLTRQTEENKIQNNKMWNMIRSIK